jgi:hypothetical protein
MTIRFQYHIKKPISGWVNLFATKSDSVFHEVIVIWLVDSFGPGE